MKTIIGHKILTVLLLFAISSAAFAQSTQKVTIKGTVRDSKNQPINGVDITVQEKGEISTTDNDGKFEISAAPQDIIIFKKKGFLTKLQPINNEVQAVNVKLAEELTEAGDDDDVEIPFGVRKKRQVTQALTVVRGDIVPNIPVTDVKNLYAGRVSGLYMQQTNTLPGNESTSFLIRGRSSYGTTAALTLVDGVEREFGDMDPQEIESITVLKDAAALAWYGLRGGNGAVIITTKKGSANQSRINFDAQYGVQARTKLIAPLNAYDYAAAYTEAQINDGVVNRRYTPEVLEAYKNGINPQLYPNNNYIDRFLNETAPTQRYVLSADGGNNTLQYFALVSYYNQQGLFRDTKTADYNSNNRYDKFNFRGNVTFNPNKNLTIALNAGGRIENRFDPTDGTASILNNIFNLPPDAFPILNSDGSYGGNSTFQTNPLGQLRDRGYVSNIDRVMLASINAKQRLDFITKGLSANVLYSYDAFGRYTSGLAEDYQVFDLTGTTGVPSAAFRTPTPLAYRGATYTLNNRRNEMWAGFDYDRVFGDHSFNASIRGQRYADVSPDRLDFRNQGLAARIDYGFKQKYFLGLVAGYSGSENFDPKQRYGFFPAISGAWIVSEESFMNGIKNTLSYLKIRASHGTAGNGQIGGSRLPFQSFYSRNATGGGYTFGEAFSATNVATEISLGNPVITWENITTTNVGLETKFFNNALSFTVDLYKNRRENILTAAALPSLLGQSISQVNAGIVDSKGIESSFNYNKQLGKFNISLNGNILLSKNNVVVENGQEGVPEYQSTMGKIAGSVLLFQSDGLFQNEDEIDASPRQTLAGTVKPGDIRYKDINGDNIIDNLDRVRTNVTDLPNTYFGFGGTVNFKNFDFSIQFAGVSGRTVNIQPYVNGGPSAFNQESLKRWTPETANIAVYPRLGISDRGNNTVMSDFWMRSMNFVRLKSLELGVKIAPNYLKKFGLQNTRFFIGGLNLLTFTNLELNVDPEIPGAGRGSAYPYMKTYTLGLSTSL
ncbi:MAG: TonB-dependent receptor [Pedobacter sp.]|uniref:SusC/RagA family TonB-linked outer membrane protein n=1 Tax=Pedobacter sp. TaxID=1411316 RepID=UPI002808E84B|nr:TonB-dependent receptor [Pedobacter sp.]MDQ8004765.1 TonB-dependent receptor [Pedobacter sp.]